MRRLAVTASALGLAAASASAQPIVEGVNAELTGRLLGASGPVGVMVVDVAQRPGERSPFQTFAEFDLADTDVRLVAAPAGLAGRPPATESPAAAAATLGGLPTFTVPGGAGGEGGRLGPALDPVTLVIGEPETLGMDTGLLALGDDEGGALPPIGIDQATRAQTPTPNPLPGAVWLLGSALLGLRLARRRG